MAEKITGAVPSIAFRRAYGTSSHIDRTDLKVEDLLGNYYGKGRVPSDLLALAKKERKPARKYLDSINETSNSERQKSNRIKFFESLDKVMQGWTRATALGIRVSHNVSRYPDEYQAKKYRNVWYIPNEIANSIKARQEAQAA